MYKHKILKVCVLLVVIVAKTKNNKYYTNFNVYYKDGLKNLSH